MSSLPALVPLQMGLRNDIDQSALCSVQEWESLRARYSKPEPFSKVGQPLPGAPTPAASVYSDCTEEWVKQKRKKLKLLAGGVDCAAAAPRARAAAAAAARPRRGAGLGLPLRETGEREEGEGAGDTA